MGATTRRPPEGTGEAVTAGMGGNHPYDTSSQKPQALPVNPGAIPAELTALSQWVGWRWRWVPPGNGKPGRWTKPPVNIRTGGDASSTNPATWATFSEALAAYQAGRCDGLGLVLTASDPYTGIDLDTCISDDGELAPWAAEIVAAMDSYTEFSPTGTGLRLFVRAQLPGGGIKRGEIELYDQARYLTVTGQCWPGAPERIARRQGEVDALYERLTVKPERPALAVAPNGHTSGADLPDGEILRRASKAANGEKFRRLFFDGDTAGYSSQSEADSALCSILAFYTRDAGQLDRLFRRSALMRDKWDEKHYGDGRTYGQTTVERALQLVSETYTPAGGRARLLVTGGKSEYYESESPSRDALPPFPVDALPDTFRTFVTEASKALGVPPDFVALPLLSTVGAAVGNRVALKLKDGWVVRPILWTTTVGLPGTGKTPAQLEATRLLEAVDQARRERHQERLEAWLSASKEERAAQPRPQPQVAIATDFTLEFLAVALPESPGVLVRMDELATWAASFTRYRAKGGSDRSAWLSLWAGVPYVRDRLTSVSGVAPRPVVCIAGSTQPDRLGALTGDETIQDGLLDRFIVAWPQAEPPEWTEAGLSDATRMAAQTAVGDIATARAPLDGVVTLTEEARALFIDWFNANRGAIAEAHGAVAGWRSKAPLHLARIALVLHAMRHPQDYPERRVSPATIRHAIEVVDYADEHFRVVAAMLQMGAARQRADSIARRVLRILTRAEGWVSRSDILNGLRNVSAETLRDALDAMERDGLIERDSQAGRTKPTELWRVASRRDGLAFGYSDYSDYSLARGDSPNNPKSERESIDGLGDGSSWIL